VERKWGQTRKLEEKTPKKNERSRGHTEGRQTLIGIQETNKVGRNTKKGEMTGRRGSGRIKG